MVENAMQRRLTPVEEFRETLIHQLRRELIGPDPLPEETDEILDESPRQRYSAGILFPSHEINRETEDDPESAALPDDVADLHPGPGMDTLETVPSSSVRTGLEEVTGDHDDTITMANTYMPSAMGMSFLCDHSSSGLNIIPQAAVYETGKRKDGEREFTIWKRRPLELPVITVSLGMPDGKNVAIQEWNVAEDLKIKAIIRARKDGSRLATISLYNTKKNVRSRGCFRFGLFFSGWIPCRGRRWLPGFPTVPGPRILVQRSGGGRITAAFQEASLLRSRPWLCCQLEYRIGRQDRLC